MKPDLEKLKALLKKATKGPWRLAKPTEKMGLTVSLYGWRADHHLGTIHTGNQEYITNAILIAEGISALPALIARVGELEGALQWLDRRGGLGLDVHDRIRAALNQGEAK